MPHPLSTTTLSRSERLQKPESTPDDDNDSLCSSASSVYDSEEDYEEENEVSRWLLQSEHETSFTLKSPASKPDFPPFRLFNTPGPLLLQFIHWLMICLGLSCGGSKPSVISPPQSSFEPASLWEHDTSLDQISYIPLNKNWDGRHAPPKKEKHWMFSRASYEEDDTEYLVPPTPGTNEGVLRIRVSDVCNEEKVDRQPRDELVIYRMSSDGLYDFGPHVAVRQLLGHAVRKPADVFDAISLVRHGHVVWDFIGNKDEVWMLVGRSHLVINRVLARIARKKPPFMTRVGHLLCKSIYKLVFPLLPKPVDWSRAEINRLHGRRSFMTKVGHRIYKKTYPLVSPWLPKNNWLLLELDEDSDSEPIEDTPKNTGGWVI